MCVCPCIVVIWEVENQRDATQCFIELVVCSTCFGHVYAHRQELATILLICHVACNSWLLVAGRWGAGRIAWPYLLEASCEGRLGGGKLFCSYVTMDNLRNALRKGKWIGSNVGTLQPVGCDGPVSCFMPRDVFCGANSRPADVHCAVCAQWVRLSSPLEWRR